VAAFLDIVLFLVFVAVPAAAVCTQVIPLRLGEVTFHDTDLAHAWMLVAQYAEGTFEQRFGYPTGYFYLDRKRSHQPSRILMREFQPAGAITDGCSTQLGALSLTGFEGGCATGCLGFFVIAFIGAPFFLVSACDRFFRLVLRSRVDVSLTAAGPDTVASFAFHGPGGYSLRRRYAQAFEKPTLPAGLGLDVAPAAAEGPEGGAPSSGRPVMPQSADGQSADGQSADGQPASGQPASGQPASGRPAGGRHASGSVT
jgi:hypothetical protein